MNQRLLDQFFTLALLNFAKTLLASMLMLFVFEYFVGRHLRRIASGVIESPIEVAAAEIALDRPRSAIPDDLDKIVTALNRRIARVWSTHSALQRQAEQLSQANEDLANTNREQAEFTYAISHDLKAPANTLEMLIDELADHHGKHLDDDGNELLHDAKGTIGRMSTLVEDVLDYSRMVGEQVKREEVDLDALLGEVLSNFRGEIARSEAEIAAAPLGYIIASRMQIQIMLQNLIGNALKFTRDGVVPRIQISLERTEMPGEVCLAVSDNGIGIAAEHCEKIFGLFHRLHTHSEFPGTGLGLSLCKRIAANHNGRIEVDSILDQGTTFRVYLRETRDD